MVLPVECGTFRGTRESCVLVVLVGNVVHNEAAETMTTLY